jgi:tetratricopeptide (TPR) repeat protein
MSGLSGESLEQFETLHVRGQAANKAGDYATGLAFFNAMDQLAQEHDDPLKRMHALNPGARALWSMGEYDQAYERLTTAEAIGTELNLVDEAAIARSNIGRLAASRIVKTISVPQQAEALRDEAVPSFAQAYEALKGHPHLYYRYANAQHGSVVAALADERLTCFRLIGEGLLVAPRKSPPYDEARAYKINRAGLIQIASSILLSPLGSHTPILTGVARNKLIR